ncbi:lysine-2,3-aminomutase-like protein [Rhizomicrobium electricum]|uniref:Lysine-2,3-aminomutase-like protein n=2 Tax=Rhizomicrobium electricum TaxID=480070 RepID=A0ABN1EYZ4_9PROT
MDPGTMTALKSIYTLADSGLVAREQLPSLEPVTEKYAVALTDTVVNLIDRSDPFDPIARQFVPSVRELTVKPDELLDPIGDDAHSPVPGIVHRHRDRALFKIVQSCPVYCRFCFRRESVGQAGENALLPETFTQAVDYVAAHPEIWEMIFTGGDPFVLSPRRIAEVSARFASIPHVKLLRWHSRVPVVDPARITDEMIAALLVPGASTVIAIHANHPRELGPDARRAIARLVDAGIPLVSQTVLLRGINDEISTLEALMRAFLECHIKPYYLHHPDLAPGTSHFRVTIDEGLTLMRALRARLSGLAIPTYVLDIPGGFAKVPLESRDVEKTETGWRIRDHEGRWHDYPPAP